MPGRAAPLGPVLPALVVVVVLFGGALLGAVRTSLQPRPGPVLAALDLSAWRAVLADARFLDAVAFTAGITVVATLLALVVALAAAHALRGRRRLEAAFTLPVLLPHLLVAVLAVLWLGSGGIADRVLAGLPFEVVRDPSGAGIVLVYVFKEAPFLTLLVLAAWTRDVGDREEAAAVLGANRWQRLTTVVWPAVRPAAVIGAAVVAAFVFGSFEVPLVVGPTAPDTVATYALDATRTAALDGQARAAAALLVAALVALIVTAGGLLGLRGRRG